MKRKRYEQNHRQKSLIVLFIVLLAASGLFACSRKSHKVSDYAQPNPFGISESRAQEETAGEKNTEWDGREEEEWSLELVNKWNPMKTSGNEVETVTLSNGERVDTRIYQQLQNMFDSARENGIYPIVASGYRTKSEQEELYYEKIAAYEAEGLSDEEAKIEAERWVAIPGTSEHQLGLAVDINADGIYSTGDQVYAWLAENAHKFGFIYRYPSDKTEITGVANEPWHYRYVGTAAAGEIHRQGICLEEYLAAEKGMS